MPVTLKITHTDDSTTELRLPAEIWVKNNRKVSRLVLTDKEIRKVEFDPHREFADVNRSNNVYPPEIPRSRFKLFEEKKQRNEMQKSGLGDPEAAPEGDDE